MKSSWTILILSKENRGIRKFSMSPLIVSLAVGFVVFLAAFSGFAGYKLYHLRVDLSRVASIKQKAVEQSRQIVALSEKVSMLDEEMNILRTFNRHLMGIAKIDLNASDELNGIGGGSEPIQAANGTEALTEKILTRELHSHIKQLGDDIVIERDVAKDLLAEIERQRSLLAHTRAHGRPEAGSRRGTAGAIRPLPARENTTREWISHRERVRLSMLRQMESLHPITKTELTVTLWSSITATVS